MEGLREFARNVWLAGGPNVFDMGAEFTTRMTIVKLDNGAVWLSSPVPVAEKTMKEISALGDVRYLIAGTPRHVWRLADARTRFPGAELWVCRRTLFTLQKGPLPVAGILGDVPVWPDFDQLEFKGNFLLSEVLFFHRATGTVILDDLIARSPALPGRPIQNAVFKIEGALSPNGGVALDMKMTFLNRRLARQSLDKLLSWDFDKLIIAHGECIESNAKQYVEKTFRWLMK